MAEMTGGLSDETLMAYADGELAPGERAEIEAALQVDPDLARRLAVFTETKEQIAGLFDAPLQGPVPDALLDVVLREGAGPASPGAALDAGRQAASHQRSIGQTKERKRGLGPILSGWLPRGWLSPVAGMAFAAALLVGGAIAWQLVPAEQAGSESGDQLVAQEKGRRIAQGDFSKALDKVVAGGKASWQTAENETVAFEPDFTFRSTDKGYCRQYRLTLGDKASAGVACRLQDGQWQIRFRMAATPRKMDASGKTVPARGRRGAIDKFVDEMIDGDVLDVIEEVKLMKRGWRD